ncbi:MAG TPA: hypothetical protein VIY51_29425 [Xanthobacteraceae bacterium]
MAETEPTNFMELHPSRPLTSTKRSRRHRERKRRKPRRAPATATPATTLPGATAQRAAATLQPIPQSHSVVTAATLVAALALATCSATFSISGLTSIFVGAFWAIIGLGIAFELGKLSAVAWLGRHGSGALRAALVVLVAILMVLNSIGVYGFLSRAHIEHTQASDLTVSAHQADVGARLIVQTGILADIDRRISQIDSAVEKTADHGRGKTAMALADQQHKARADLAAARVKEAETLAGLQVQQAAVEGERKAVEADLGPVRYLATLVGASDETTMRLFILIVAMLLDPAAVLLLLTATHRRASR